jgi:hypothetical protein
MRSLRLTVLIVVLALVPTLSQASTPAPAVRSAGAFASVWGFLLDLWSSASTPAKTVPPPTTDAGCGLDPLGGGCTPHS